jgi:hypothetical protein
MVLLINLVKKSYRVFMKMQVVFIMVIHGVLKKENGNILMFTEMKVKHFLNGLVFPVKL